jgi:uncharacterized protein YukE
MNNWIVNPETLDQLRATAKQVIESANEDDASIIVPMAEVIESLIAVCEGQAQAAINDRLAAAQERANILTEYRLIRDIMRDSVNPADHVSRRMRELYAELWPIPNEY